MVAPLVVHKHNPKTGGHLCKAPVPSRFRWNKKWTVGFSNPVVRTNRVLSAPLDSSGFQNEDYLGGEWCCENDPRKVNCPACKKLMEAK